MKKLLIWGFAALPLLTILATSCSKETVESRTDKDGQITFNTAVGKQTKAEEFAYWAVDDEINVYSYVTGSDQQFLDFELTYEGSGAWSYTGSPVFQPGYSITYYSYYPEDNVSSVTLDGTAGTFEYAVQVEADQEDLIAAVNPTIDHEVNLYFNHLLSQINFAIQGMEDFKITVTDIAINGVKDSGTYTFGSGWSALSGDADYEYTPAVTAETDGTDDTILYLGNTGNSVGVPDNSNDNALMLMPQSFSGDDGTLSFTYTISDMSDVEIRGDDVEIDLGDFDVTTWAAGYRYLYLIDFEGEEIVFFVYVNPWLDGDVTVVEP